MSVPRVAVHAGKKTALISAVLSQFSAYKGSRAGYRAAYPPYVHLPVDTAYNSSPVKLPTSGLDLCTSKPVFVLGFLFTLILL